VRWRTSRSSRLERAWNCTPRGGESRVFDGPRMDTGRGGARAEVMATKSDVAFRCMVGKYRKTKSAENLMSERKVAYRQSFRRRPRGPRESGAMGSTAFFGRFLFAFVFLASSVNKLLGLSDPGVGVLDAVSPRLAVARESLSRKIGIDPLFLVSDGWLVNCASLIELFGSLLFVLDFALGAKLLLLFTLCVTPVMHAFWRLDTETESAEQAVEQIMFFKNAALAGALLVYLDMKPRVGGMRGKAKRR
jgi:uncharacterized membrane protein YphA (DoxX/SURF4 family)